MSERWHIIDIHAQGRVLQVLRSARAARRAQRQWFKLRLWHSGPETAIRRVAVKDDE